MTSMKSSTTEEVPAPSDSLVTATITTATSKKEGLPAPESHLPENQATVETSPKQQLLLPASRSMVLTEQQQLPSNEEPSSSSPPLTSPVEQQPQPHSQQQPQPPHPFPYPYPYSYSRYGGIYGNGFGTPRRSVSRSQPGEFVLSKASLFTALAYVGVLWFSDHSACTVGSPYTNP